VLLFDHRRVLLGLLCFAIEGIICIAMAAPIPLPSLFAGHILGFEFGQKEDK
jgi:hypothetical protein